MEFVFSVIWRASANSNVYVGVLFVGGVGRVRVWGVRKGVNNSGVFFFFFTVFKHAGSVGCQGSCSGMWIGTLSMVLFSVWNSTLQWKSGAFRFSLGFWDRRGPPLRNSRDSWLCGSCDGWLNRLPTGGHYWSQHAPLPKFGPSLRQQSHHKREITLYSEELVPLTFVWFWKRRTILKHYSVDTSEWSKSFLFL